MLTRGSFAVEVRVVDHGIRVSPGAKVALYQAFRCCPYAALITAKMHRFFEENGCEITGHCDQADLQVINTCGFNESRTEQALEAIERHRREGPGRPMVIVGCLPKIDPGCLEEALGDEAPWLMVGPHEHGRLDSLLAAPRRAFAEVQANLYEERYSLGDPRMGLYQVPVGTGCLNHCSYCVIRQAKGTPRSRSVDEISREVRRGIELGHENILLSGDDIASWGVDLGSNVAELLDQLSRIEGVHYSVEALEPSRTLPHLDALLQVFARGCFAWIVFSVQSGSDRVLKAMGRRYTRADIERALRCMRAAAPHMFISSDFIFGFADESREEFEQTLAICALFDHCDFNEYEQRPGTPAATSTADEMEYRRARVSAYARQQGEQVDKIAFADQRSRARDGSGTAPRAETGAADVPAAAPGHGHGARSGSAHHDRSPSSWVVEHVEKLRTAVEQRGAELGSAGSIARIVADEARVIVEVARPGAGEPLKYMLTKRDAGTRCIAFSADYNLGLIWDKKTPCNLDAVDIEALEALKGRFGLTTDPS